MKTTALLLVLLTSVARAAIPVVVETPETEVEISLFDLVKKRPPPPGLPADYGARVARAIEERRALLTDCIEGDDRRLTVAVRLQIAGDGRALVADADEKPGSAWHCLSGILGAIRFPKHPLPKEVTVRFPLTLEKKTL